MSNSKSKEQRKTDLTTRSANLVNRSKSWSSSCLKESPKSNLSWKLDNSENLNYGKTSHKKGLIILNVI